MPLSEDEERILTEIESHLYASDPALAKQVRSTTVYTAGLRGVRWGILGVIVGLAALLALLQVNVFASFIAGFGLMLFSAWHLERSIRKLGRTGLQQATQKVRSSNVRSYISGATDRARERMRRDDDHRSN